MKKKILFVEDDCQILETMVEYFQMLEEFEVFQATDGKEALKVIQSQSIDVMFTDLNMPHGMSGFELIEKIQDSNQKPKKTYILSGYIDNQINSLKTDGYLIKPIDFKILLEKIGEK